MSEEDNPKFSAAEINLVLHATEDEDKVLKAIEDVLLVPSERFSSSPSQGHYKNKILLLKALLSSQEASSLAKRVISLLNAADREHLSRLVHEHSDEKGNLYIRLDKQRMCQGRVSLSETDAIRIRFKPVKRYKPSSTIQGYEELFDLHLNG
ncbi:MAG TPA: RNA-binding domain-containing protein [Nitrososphaera sp.]|jgi:RNA binding exosome subunit|nr:RNA-binding domain-containing protein [Nitrososphaera sp.]